MRGDTRVEVNAEAVEMLVSAVALHVREWPMLDGKAVGTPTTSVCF